MIKLRTAASVYPRKLRVMPNAQYHLTNDCGAACGLRAAAHTASVGGGASACPVCLLAWLWAPRCDSCSSAGHKRLAAPIADRHMNISLPSACTCSIHISPPCVASLHTLCACHVRCSECLTNHGVGVGACAQRRRAWARSTPRAGGSINTPAPYIYISDAYQIDGRLHCMRPSLPTGRCTYMQRYPGATACTPTESYSVAARPPARATEWCMSALTDLCSRTASAPHEPELG